MIAQLFSRKSIEVRCKIEIEHTFDSLHAHVELDDGIAIEPGDQVRVHGAPIRVPYGARAVIHRDATVVKASPIERVWTRATGDLEFMELCEFSFSSGRTL